MRGQPIAVGLGGNIGKTEAILARFRAAIRLLVARGAFDVRSSHVYESAPVGPVANQPRFLNAVVGFRLPSPARPLELLGWLWGIESSLGRRRPVGLRQGPRPIDLDLLLWGTLRMTTLALTLPHPRAAERAFVTRPLAEIMSASPPRSDDHCRAIGEPDLIL